MLATERRGVPVPAGALPLRCLGMEGPRAPDVAFSFAWDQEVNPWGQPGYTFSAGKVNLAGGMAGLGTHGSLSPADMRACLACAGPAFLANVDVRHATGHPDVAPTVLAALGLGRPACVEGRPILAALRPAVAAAAAAVGAVGEYVEETFEVERRLPAAGGGGGGGGRVYRQRMVVGFEAGRPETGRMVSSAFDRSQDLERLAQPAAGAAAAAALGGGARL